MYWFWTVIIMFFTFSFSSFPSEAKKHHKKSSAVVVGTVYCDTCFQQQDIVPKASHFIAGATIAVECKNPTTSNPPFRQESQTDIHGQFKVPLPFPVSSKHPTTIKGCSVKLISSNKPHCSTPAATAASPNLHLRSRKRGIHVFSAGLLAFKPSKKPTVCDQKLDDDPTFPPPIQDPLPSVPPALLPPLPQLPPVPLPGMPFLPPKPEKETELSDDSNDGVNQPDSFQFPPNPFNPPSIFPPNPFQPAPSLIPPVFPSPPTSIFPPIFPSPPSPPFLQLPPIPSLTPSPPPPVLPIHLPPFPFQPSPGFPGLPPAEVSAPLKTATP